jgi:cyanate lyase
VKKILFMVLCVALLASCSSSKRVDAMVESTITEAIVLQEVAKTHGAEVSISTSNLVADARKQKDEEKNIDAALLKANEAILLLQISLLEREKKNIEDSLSRATEILRVNRALLSDRKAK